MIGPRPLQEWRVRDLMVVVLLLSLVIALITQRANLERDRRRLQFQSASLNARNAAIGTFQRQAENSVERLFAAVPPESEARAAALRQAAEFYQSAVQGQTTQPSDLDRFEQRLGALRAELLELEATNARNSSRQESP